MKGVYGGLQKSTDEETLTLKATEKALFKSIGFINQTI